MALYLVQHGKAFAKHEDRLRGLIPEGRSDVERIANVASGYGVRASRILHSGKTRARQTAELYAVALKPERGVQERGGMGPLDDVTVFEVPRVRLLRVGEGGHSGPPLPEGQGNWMQSVPAGSA